MFLIIRKYLTSHIIFVFLTILFFSTYAFASDEAKIMDQNNESATTTSHEVSKLKEEKPLPEKRLLVDEWKGLLERGEKILPAEWKSLVERGKKMIENEWKRLEDEKEHLASERKNWTKKRRNGKTG